MTTEGKGKRAHFHWVLINQETKSRSNHHLRNLILNFIENKLDIYPDVAFPAFVSGHR